MFGRKQPTPTNPLMAWADYLTNADTVIWVSPDGETYLRGQLRDGHVAFNDGTSEYPPAQGGRSK